MHGGKRKRRERTKKKRPVTTHGFGVVRWFMHNASDIHPTKPLCLWCLNHDSWCIFSFFFNFNFFLKSETQNYSSPKTPLLSLYIKKRYRFTFYFQPRLLCSKERFTPLHFLFFSYTCGGRHPYLIYLFVLQYESHVLGNILHDTLFNPFFFPFFFFAFNLLDFGCWVCMYTFSCVICFNFDVLVHYAVVFRWCFFLNLWIFCIQHNLWLDCGIFTFSPCT
jgi:hypothetical protein